MALKFSFLKNPQW